MAITRRGWIGAAALAGGASLIEPRGARATPAVRVAPDVPLPAGAFEVRAPGPGGARYGAALAALRDYALSELGEIGLPGMTLAVTDRDGFTAVLALGWADVDRRVPLTPDRYFQIGSISKSFLALAVLALADQGLIDLDAPLARYLPEAPLPAEPITIAQVLSHVAGLPDGAPIFPRTPDGRLWVGFAPGSKFSYSNTGYELLGRVVERVTGAPHQVAVDRLVIGRLGLTDIAGTIRQADRRRYAVGYWPWDEAAVDDLPKIRLGVASWDPEDTAAGSIGATGEAMAAYLRAMMRIAAGQGAPVLSAAAARRFARPVVDAPDFGPGARYACGVALQPVDGVMCLHHTGGMMAFSSSFHADPAAGVACFASVNARMGDYRPRATTALAIRLMRAARSGADLPAAPDPLAPYRILDVDAWLGRYVAQGGESFAIVASAGGARLEGLGASGALGPRGGVGLVTDHPRFARFGFDAVRENGRVTGLWWGDTLYSRGAARPSPTPAGRLTPFAGVYLNRDPWVGGAVLMVRGDRLVLEGGGPLTEHGGWWCLDKDPGGLERLRFEAMLNGRFTRLNASGRDLLRLTV